MKSVRGDILSCVNQKEAIFFITVVPDASGLICWLTDTSYKNKSII